MSDLLLGACWLAVDLAADLAAIDPEAYATLKAFGQAKRQILTRLQRPAAAT